MISKDVKTGIKHIVEVIMRHPELEIRFRNVPYDFVDKFHFGGVFIDVYDKEKDLINTVAITDVIEFIGSLDEMFIKYIDVLVKQLIERK